MFGRRQQAEIEELKAELAVAKGRLDQCAKDLSTARQRASEWSEEAEKFKEARDRAYRDLDLHSRELTKLRRSANTQKDDGPRELQKIKEVLRKNSVFTDALAEVWRLTAIEKNLLQEQGLRPLLSQEVTDTMEAVGVDTTCGDYASWLKEIRASFIRRADAHRLFSKEIALAKAVRAVLPESDE